MAPKKRKSEDEDGPTLGNPGADPQRIHREYVEQHFGGGEEPTPEAYERALDEWHRLPGAAHRPPGEIRGPEEAEALEQRRAPASAAEAAPLDEGAGKTAGEASGGGVDEGASADEAAPEEGTTDDPEGGAS